MKLQQNKQENNYDEISCDETHKNMMIYKRWTNDGMSRSRDEGWRDEKIKRCKATKPHKTTTHYTRCPEWGEIGSSESSLNAAWTVLSYK